MSALRLAIPVLVLAAAGAGIFLTAREKPRPLTAEDLQGEWVQDPAFLQHAGSDLDAQKREVDAWENYEFAFHGQRLTAWRIVHDDTARDNAGWSQGRGTGFSSEFSIAPAEKAAALTFDDHAKTRQQATLAWDGDALLVSLGERKFRLKKAPAENLRLRKLITQP